jgi:hypothetical protein
MPETTTKTARRRARTAKPKPAAPRPEPTHAEISERAYFIHLEEGGRDELTNWLRAESELAIAA